MDIHKPKAAHSWREFLIEIGTIICGILIALALEQGIEFVHWRERTEQTEHRLRAELADMGGQAAYQIDMQRCTWDMLFSVRDALRKSGDEWTPPHKITSSRGSIVLFVPTGVWDPQGWKNAQADGTANRIPPEEADLFGGAYARVAAIRERFVRTAEEEADLNSLAVVRKLDTASRAEYLQKVYRVSSGLNAMDALSANLLRNLKDLNITPNKIDETEPQMRLLRKMCADYHNGLKDIRVAY